MSPECRETLLADLLASLRALSGACSEHTLLKYLRAQHCAALPDGPLANPLVLFRSHWLLFHGLYELRDRLLARGEGLLRVDPLDIRLLPYTAGQQGLAAHDPLREVYRDLTPLQTTGAADVLALMGSFQARLRAARHYHQALQVLDLQAPADLAVVRQQYRRLAMRHHPDRGGDASHFATLREARETLERYFGA